MYSPFEPCNNYECWWVLLQYFVPCILLFHLGLLVNLSVSQYLMRYPWLFSIMSSGLWKHVIIDNNRNFDRYSSYMVIIMPDDDIDLLGARASAGSVRAYIQITCVRLTYWGQDKIATISQMTLKCIFLSENVRISFKLSLEFVP